MRLKRERSKSRLFNLLQQLKLSIKSRLSIIELLTINQTLMRRFIQLCTLSSHLSSNLSMRTMQTSLLWYKTRYNSLRLTRTWTTKSPSSRRSSKRTMRLNHRKRMILFTRLFYPSWKRRMKERKKKKWKRKWRSKSCSRSSRRRDKRRLTCKRSKRKSLQSTSQWPRSLNKRTNWRTRLQRSKSRKSKMSSWRYKKSRRLPMRRQRMPPLQLRKMTRQPSSSLPLLTI